MIERMVSRVEGNMQIPFWPWRTLAGKEWDLQIANNYYKLLHKALDDTLHKVQWDSWGPTESHTEKAENLWAQQLFSETNTWRTPRTWYSSCWKSSILLHPRKLSLGAIHDGQRDATEGMINDMQNFLSWWCNAESK